MLKRCPVLPILTKSHDITRKCTAKHINKRERLNENYTFVFIKHISYYTVAFNYFILIEWIRNKI